MEQFPAESSSYPAHRKYYRRLQYPSLYGEQEEHTYLQAEKKRPRYDAYEVEKQDNSEAKRKPTLQNAPSFTEKEFNGVEVSNLISPPSYFTCEEENDTFPRPSLPLYSLHSVFERPFFQNRELEGASQTNDLPLPNVNHHIGSWAFQPNRMDQSEDSSHGNVLNCSSCPKHCPRICQEPQDAFPSFTAFREKRQRPGVIMVPVSRNKKINEAAVTHVPLQPEDSFTSKKEDRYFRKIMDKTKATFTLTESDWQMIIIKNFPSGGRLLGGDWTKIFHSKLKQSNPWCNLRFKNNHVRSENSRKRQSAPFFRGSGECKRPECGLKLKFYIQEEKGKYVDISYSGDICHKFKN
ncbi:uncharacterized protein [Montipora foliosa]|uniref:uncharacterized protein n=1 Tax=Montipora foliosa TaxID=591990 RepID=UPI0035F1593E